MPLDETDRPLADDILWGADAIARYIGRSRRQTFHMLQTGLLPARKVGDQWIASKAELRQRFRPEPKPQ